MNNQPKSKYDKNYLNTGKGQITLESVFICFHLASWIMQIFNKPFPATSFGLTKL